MQRLNLGKNKLTAIPHEALVSLTYLETLELSGNQISNLSPGDFNGEFLYHKSFPKKLFLKIDFFQPGLDNLDQLVLNDNKLEHLGEDYFTGISKLTTLYLDQNKIKTINAKAFNGIEGKYLLHTSPFTQKIT